ncbi:MAG TPA: lysophospholipid acyltransferase family protein [Syntrophorhabdaceae bacterium]
MIVDPFLIIAVKSFQQALRFLPEKIQRSIGAAFGRGAYLALRERRRVAVSNLLEALPSLGKAGATAVARKCLENLGINFVESMVLPFIPPNDLTRRFTIENRHYADDALAAGKGLVALVFHYANWEIMGVASRLLHHEIVVLARPLKRHRRINEFLNSMRAETGLTIIPNANSARDVMRYLKEGRIVAILGDQREKRSKAVYVDFFGRKAPTSRGIAMIGMKTGAPVVPFYFRREGFLRYTIVCCPPLLMERKGNIEELVARNMRRVNECLESIVRERPEEWFWVHRRWARKG